MQDVAPSTAPTTAQTASRTGDPRRFLLWLGLIAAAGLAVRVGYVWSQLGSAVGGDGYAYYHQAGGLLTGHRFRQPAERAERRHPPPAVGGRAGRHPLARGHHLGHAAVLRRVRRCRHRRAGGGRRTEAGRSPGRPHRRGHRRRLPRPLVLRAGPALGDPAAAGSSPSRCCWSTGSASVRDWVGPWGWGRWCALLGQHPGRADPHRSAGRRAGHPRRPPTRRRRASAAAPAPALAGRRRHARRGHARPVDRSTTSGGSSSSRCCSRTASAVPPAWPTATRPTTAGSPASTTSAAWSGTPTARRRSSTSRATSTPAGGALRPRRPGLGLLGAVPAGRPRRRLGPLAVRHHLAALFGYWLLVVPAVAGGVVLRRRRVPIYPLVGFVVTVVTAVALTFGEPRYRARRRSPSCCWPPCALDDAVAPPAAADRARPPPMPSLPRTTPRPRPADPESDLVPAP